jgi:hypothetical protein
MEKRSDVIYPHSGTHTEERKYLNTSWKNLKSWCRIKKQITEEKIIMCLEIHIYLA